MPRRQLEDENRRLKHLVANLTLDKDSEPNKINASTHFDFAGKNLTPYGGLLPVVTIHLGTFPIDLLTELIATE